MWECFLDTCLVRGGFWWMCIYFCGDLRVVETSFVVLSVFVVYLVGFWVNFFGVDSDSREYGWF